MTNRRARDAFPVSTRATEKADQLAPSPFEFFTRIGVPDEISGFDRDIAKTADRLVGALRRAKELPVASKPNGISPEDARFLAYTLVVYRTRYGVPLTEHHLRLLAEVLDIKRPSLGAARMIGLPPVKNLQALADAADIQGRRPAISESQLAQLVSVDRKTIRAWRKLKQFKDRARHVRLVEGNATDEDRALVAMWDQAIAKVNAELAREHPRSEE